MVLHYLMALAVGSGDVRMRGGCVMPPIFSRLPERWSNVSHAARELVTAFYVTFF